MVDGFRKRGERVEEETHTIPWRITIQSGLEGSVLSIVNFSRRPNFLG
jgi:hypothetical protein